MRVQSYADMYKSVLAGVTGRALYPRKSLELVRRYEAHHSSPGKATQ